MTAKNARTPLLGEVTREVPFDDHHDAPPFQGKSAASRYGGSALSIRRRSAILAGRTSADEIDEHAAGFRPPRTRRRGRRRRYFIDFGTGFRAIDDLAGRVVDPEDRSVALAAPPLREIFQFISWIPHLSSPFPSESRIGMTQAR
jgi:hypothetical protein